MSTTKEFTYAEVAKHTERDDIYIVVHDKVYNATAFVSEHPGGEEVLLDLGGQDATEAFEDVGHSDEARSQLTDLLVGDLKRVEGDPAPKTSAQGSMSKGGNLNASGTAGGMGGWMMYALLGLGGVAAYMAYAWNAAAGGARGAGVGGAHDAGR